MIGVIGSSTPAEYDTRFSRHSEHSIPVSHPVEFPGLNATSAPRQSLGLKSFTDDVTKFGDINGPITAVQQRPQRGILFGSDDFRGPRPFVPPKMFVEYPSDYPVGHKTRFHSPKQSLLARVVCPSIDISFPSGPSSGGYLSDSVAFWLRFLFL